MLRKVRYYLYWSVYIPCKTRYNQCKSYQTRDVAFHRMRKFRFFYMLIQKLDTRVWKMISLTNKHSQQNIALKSYLETQKLYIGRITCHKLDCKFFFCFFRCLSPQHRAMLYSHTVRYGYCSKTKPFISTIELEQSQIIEF